MAGYYLVIKNIYGNRYYYYQRTWREGKKVKCHCIYVGRADSGIRPASRLMFTPQPKKMSPSEELAHKINRAQTPYDVIRLSKEHTVRLASTPKASMNGGMNNKYPGDPAAEGIAALRRDDVNRQAAAELANLSGFHEDRWFEHASVQGINLNEYLAHAKTLEWRERDAHLNKLIDEITGYNAEPKASMNGCMKPYKRIANTFENRKGTSLQGDVQIPYAELVAKFGAPGQNDGYKVDAEWILDTPVGRVTIYNYKAGKNYLGEEGTPTEHITDWHIGGKNRNAAEWVHATLGKRESASASSPKGSMNGNMNRRKILGIPDGLHFRSLADEIAHEHKKLYRHMFGVAKDCPHYPAFMERLHQDGLLTSCAEITSFVRYCTGNRKLTDEEAGKMLETLYLGMTIALPPDEDDYPGDPAAEGNMTLRLNHLRELQSQASHPGAVAAKKIGRLMPEISEEQEREVLKSIAEKGYYEQPLEQKQAFCKKTGGHRDFIIGEQKEIDGQLHTEYKCGWCGTIEYR